MKKLNYLMLGAAGLLMASCSSEDLQNPDQVGDGNVNITVKLPVDMATRALSDGLKADNLHIAVYDADNGNAFLWEDEASFDGAIQTTVSMNLAQGKTYNIAFFAVSDAGEQVYSWNPNTDTPNITVNYSPTTYLSNENLLDAYDCFYQLENIAVSSGTLSRTVTLYRPVAQINWGTSDLGEQSVSSVNAFGPNGEYIVSNLTIANAYTQFSLLNKDVYGTTSEQTLSGLATPAAGGKIADCDAANWLFPVDPKTYEYVAMQYVLASREESSVYDLTLNMNNGGAPAGVTTVSANDVVVASAPVQANYRTNIYGTLLSDNVEIVVVKDPEWYKPDNNFELIDGVEYLVISAANVNDLYRGKGNFILSEDVTYSSDKALQWLYDMNLNLNGYELTSDGIAPYYDGAIIQGLNSKGVNVKLSNGTFTAANANADLVSATIVVQGATNPAHLTLDNMTVTGPYPIRMTSGNTQSTITINSGTYYSTTPPAPAVLVGATATSTSAGKVYINGGTFGKAGETNAYLLNVIDNLAKNTDPRNYIEVFGGTFINFNPAECGSEGFPTNFVADGYKVVASTQGDDTYYTVVPNSTVAASTAEQVNEASKNGGDVIFDEDIKGQPEESAYVGLTSIVQNGGTIDGNGKTLNDNAYSVNGKETYGIYTSGGTIKNLTIINCFRSILVAEKMTEDLYIENCNITGAYALNTAGSSNNYSMYVSNTTFTGWTSWAALQSASFTNCTFKISNIFGDPYFNKLFRPYVATTFSNCNFQEGMIAGLSVLPEGVQVVFSNCTVGSTPLTAANAATLFSEIELPEGKTLADVAVFN